MNDLYIHQLETENKQIREQLQICRNAINEIKEELNKTIDAKDKIIKEQVIEISKLREKINKVIELINYYGIDKEHNDSSTLRSILKQFLEILGDKENE